MGLVDNVKMVLGQDVRFWLVPTPPDDDALETCRGGLSFHPDEHEELFQVLSMEGKAATELMAAVMAGGPSAKSRIDSSSRAGARAESDDGDAAGLDAEAASLIPAAQPRRSRVRGSGGGVGR
jgi:hypothetical protein